MGCFLAFDSNLILFPYLLLRGCPLDPIASACSTENLCSHIILAEVFLEFHLAPHGKYFSLNGLIICFYSLTLQFLKVFLIVCQACWLFIFLELPSPSVFHLLLFLIY